MHIHHHLHKLPKKFCVDIFSKKEPYFQLLVDTLHFFLKYKEEHIICLTLEHSSHDIHRAVEKLIKDTDRLYFVDAISIFRDYGLPYKNFDIVNRPDLTDDIWNTIDREIKKRIDIDKKVVVVLYYVSSLLEYMDINQLVMFIGPLIRQIKEMGASIVMLSGIEEGHMFQLAFHSLVDEVIEV